MISAIIIDDEKNSRELLRSLISEYCSGIQIIGEAESVNAGLTAIQKYSPELIFLDIEMSDGNGFDLLDRLKSRNTLVCFVTGYNEYAIQAIRYGAFDYLLKPIEISELRRLVEKARLKLKGNSDTDSEQLILEESGKLTIFDYSEIEYLQGDGNYTLIFSTKDKKYISSENLGYFEALLNKERFVRSHKSYIVNLSFISQVELGRTGLIKLKSGKEIPVASRRKKEFVTSLKDFSQ